MLLKSVILKNFGSIKSASINFDNSSTPAIYVFNGDNGSGKSTIIKAISILLIDWCKGKLEDYINWDAEYFEIEANFTHLGKQFRSYLKYDGSSNRILEIDDGAKVDKFVNSAAISHLKSYFDPKLFRASAFSFEGEIDVIETSPAERRESLKKIHDVEFKEELSKIEAELAPLKKQLEGLEGQIIALANKDYSLLDVNDLPFSVVVLEEKEKQLKEVSESIRQASIINEDLDRKQRESSIMSDKISKIDTDFRSSVLRITSLEEGKKTLLEKKSSLVAKREKIEEEVTVSLDFERSSLVSRLEGLKKSLDEKQLVRLPALTNSFEIESLVTKISEKASEINTIENNNRVFASGFCPTCGKPADQHDLKESSERLNSLAKEKESFKVELAQLRSRKEEYDRLVLKNSETEAIRTKTEHEIQMIESSLVHLENRKQAEIDFKKREIDSSLSMIDLQLETNEKETSSEKSRGVLLQQEKKEYEAKYEELLDYVRSHQKIDVSEKTVFEKNLSKSINDYFVAEGIRNQTLRINKETLKKQAEDQVLLEKFKLEKDDLLKKIQIVETAFDVVKRDLPNFIISKLIISITNSMNDFLKKTYEGKFKITVLESKNALRIVYGPKNTDVSLSSGYERQVINSAYKFAKEQMLGLGFLILDEVDSAASDKNSKAFYETLGELPYRQLLVITHKKSTKDILSQNYGATVFDCEKGEIRS